MLSTEKNMMGRVGAFMTMISCCAIPLGSAITGTISELLPMTTIFAIMGGIIILMGIRAKMDNRLRKQLDERGDSDLKDVKHLKTLEEIRAISTYRYKILNCFYKIGEPITVKQLADELGRFQQRYIIM